MARNPDRGWRIITDRAWLYEYAFAEHGRANCLALRREAGDVVVLSPAAGLSEAAYAELEQLGPVSALVATNGHHHLGLGPFRARFPAAKTYAPALAAARISKKNSGAGPLQPLSALSALLGNDLVIREAPGTRSGELWAFARGENGYVWFVSDILVNIEKLPGALIPRLIFKLSGSGPGYRVFHAALALMVKDKKALLRALLADMESHPPDIVIPAHGEPLQSDAADSGSTLPERTCSLLRSALA